MKSPSKVSKGGSHQPDSETRIVLHHETDSGPTHLVPYNAAGGAYKSFGNGTRLTKEEVRRVKREQRNTQGGYSSEFFFPTHAKRTGGDNLTDEDRLDRTAIRRATRYLCDRTFGCQIGDCLCALQQSDIIQFRQQFMHRKIAASGKMIPQKDLLVADLARAWNRSTDVWETLILAVDDVTSVRVCPASYGLLCGVAFTSLRAAMDAVKTALVTGGQLVPAAMSVQNVREQRSEDWTLLRQYVAELLDKHEANPAPGAHQPGRMTHISKTTWKDKWAACQFRFKDAPRVPGSKSMLKKVWKLEKMLKEKKACAHSKCNICSTIDRNMDALRGVNTPEARRKRLFNQRAGTEHEGMHLGSRSELDKAGFHAFTAPREMWTVMADAATQRNFMIPKFKFRVPKKLNGRPFWSYKLMATYAYGYGFTPFLVHSSQPMGANLTWTVLWLTLCAMRKHYGFWPTVLHLTLDNTTGENKNETLLAMCAWLVATGRIKQVRVLFLMVGHTHVIIDHIFGVITVGLRRKELLLPEDLVRNIEGSLAENPQYMAKPLQILHCLWDFKAWCGTMKMENIQRLYRGHIQDKEGTYTGMYDLLFSRHRTDMCRLQYREHCSFAWLPESSEGAKTIGVLPTSPPELQKIKSWPEWSMEGSKSVKDTIVMCLEFARTLTGPLSKAYVKDAWAKHYALVPNTIELLHPTLKLNFEFFSDIHNDVLRIGTTERTGAGTAHATEQEKDDEAEYQAWKLQNVDVRTVPLAIDPVVSSAQSSKQYDVLKAAMQAACRPDLHPTLSAASPIFMGDFVIAVGASGFAELHNVASIENMMSPFATDIEVTGVLYEHVPNAAVSGLFGTFKMQMTLVGSKRQQTRRIIARSHIKVYNASFNKKTRVLSIRTLRALALAMPEHYPFPKRQDIPEEHLADDSDEEEEREPKKKPKKKNSRRDWSKAMPPIPKARRASRQQPQNASSSESDSDSSSDSDSDSEPTSSSDDNESAVPSSEECVDCEDDEVAAGVPNPGVPLLAGPSLEPELGKVIALNMVNDEEYANFEHPVGFAYVYSTTPFEVCWYQCSEDQLQGKARGKPHRAFRHSNGAKSALKMLTISKYWENPDWFRPGKRGSKPTQEQILANWHRSKAHRNWIMPVTVPQPASDRVLMNDTLKLDMKWVRDTLIPACEEAGCIQGH